MSSSFPWLTVLAVIPLVGALVVAFAPGSGENAKRLALGFSLLTLVGGIAAATQFDADSSAQFQLVEQRSWIPQFGVSYALGVDGIALTLILMSLVLVPVCLLAAWHDVDAADDRRTKSYFALLLSLETFIIGVFSATDVFLFYVFFEAMLIPVYFLIGQYGREGRKAAATKFLIYGLLGGLIMLVGVIGVYLQGPGGADGFLVSNLTGLDLAPSTERLLFASFFFAFALKAPMVPGHAWLPDAATAATPATSTLLVGVLDKVGTFGMIRFCLQMFPEASAWATPLVVTLAVISVVYGAILAIGQTDMLRLVSYTSISHFGFIVLGIFAFTNTSGAGSSLYMVNHGFSTAALFLFVGMLMRRRGGSALVTDFGGWQRVTPALAGIFFVAGLSALSMPGLSTFISEIMVLVGSFQTRPVAAVIATSGIILAALYVLLMYKKVMTGPKPAALASADALDEHGGIKDPSWAKRSGSVTVPDLTGREKLVAAPLLAIMLVLGFYPKPAFDLINPAVDTSFAHVQSVDTAATAAEGSAK